MTQNLEQRMDISRMVRAAGMSARPEFYSGRGATTSDLNGKLLEGFYQTIKQQLNETAAEQFVQMVADIPELSATDFLLTLYGLDQNNWKWDKELLGNQNGIYVDGKNEQDRNVSAISTIVEVVSRKDPNDQTEHIRNPFLRRHGINVKESSSYWGY